MGWRTATTLWPIFCKTSHTWRVVWLLPAPVRTAHTATTGLLLVSQVVLVPISRKVGAGGQHLRCLVHDILMGHVGIGKDHLVYAVLADEIYQLLFGVDGDAVRVEAPCQLRRVDATFDVWDLGGSKGHNLVLLVVAEENVKVVKVATGSAHDQDTGTGHS